MSHTWINALNGQWINGYVVQGTDLKTLDTNITACLNGDGGGTWTPAAAINVGGAGMWAAALWTLNVAGIANTPSGSGKRFTHGDSDYFVLAGGHTGSTRVIHTSCLDARTAGYWSTNTTFVGIAPVGAVGQSFVVPLKVHNGATLTQAVLTFRVGQTHPNVPTQLPTVRLVKIDSNFVVTPLNTSFTGNYDATGALVFNPTPSTGANWYNSGNAQTITYACDASLVIDTSTYTYFAVITDESGTNALCGTGANENIYQDLALTFTNIADMRPQL